MSFKSKSTFVDHEKVKQLFEKYDFNKNGVLEPDEFLTIMVDIMRTLGEDIPEKKHQEVAEEGLARFDLIYNKSLLSKNRHILYIINFILG